MRTLLALSLMGICMAASAQEVDFQISGLTAANQPFTAAFDIATNTGQQIIVNDGSCTTGYSTSGLVVTNFAMTLNGHSVPAPVNTFAVASAPLVGTCALGAYVPGIGIGPLSNGPYDFLYDAPGTPPTNATTLAGLLTYTTVAGGDGSLDGIPIFGTHVVVSEVAVSEPPIWTLLLLGGLGLCVAAAKAMGPLGSAEEPAQLAEEATPRAALRIRLRCSCRRCMG
jgi:hypothetical protein